MQLSLLDLRGFMMKKEVSEADKTKRLNSFLHQDPAGRRRKQVEKEV